MDPNDHMTMPDPQAASRSNDGAQPAAPQQDAVPGTPEEALPVSVIPSMPLPGVPTDQPVGQPAQQTAQAATDLAADMPPIAEDSDLIEQEWVHKAKQIVDRTASDPHEQNKEINKIKADYIKKRYNREIKVNEA